MAEKEEKYLPTGNILDLIAGLEKQMYAAAKDLEFDLAAEIRDKIKKLREKDLTIPA